jgi:hypothetical protein
MVIPLQIYRNYFGILASSSLTFKKLLGAVGSMLMDGPQSKIEFSTMSSPPIDNG